MKEVHELTSLDEIEAFLEKHKLSLLYVSRPECIVCHAILPKLRDMLTYYPYIHLGHVNANEVEAVAAKFLIFTAPTILLMINQKEYTRANQFVRFEQLSAQIEQMYRLALLDGA